jgi:hypothetical protein
MTDALQEFFKLSGMSAGLDADDDLTSELGIELADVTLLMIQLLQMNFSIEGVAISKSLRTDMKINASIDIHNHLPHDLILHPSLPHLRWRRLLHIITPL